MSMYVDQYEWFRTELYGIKTSTTSSPYTSLDGLSFADRYPLTMFSFFKFNNHFNTVLGEGYVTRRAAYARWIDGPSNQMDSDIELNLDSGIVTNSGAFDLVNNTITTGASDRWAGNFTSDTLIMYDNFGPDGNNAFSASSSGRWLAFAQVYVSDTIKKEYLIDPSDGTIIFTNTRSELQTSTSLLTSQTSFRYALNISAPSESGDPDGVDGAYIGEVCVWRRELSQSDLQAFAQVGFASINEPTDLVVDWNFLVDWRSTSSADTINDSSTYGATGTFETFPLWYTASPWNNFSTDNPVPVFIPQITDNQHDTLSLDIFSGVAGECYFSIYAANATAPTEAEIVAGSGLTNGNITLDGTNTVSTSIAQPDTGTDYIIYFVQDENDAGSYGPIVPKEYTSSTKYSEIITDIEGTETTNLNNIKYKWYDSTDLSALGSSTADGTTEVTDGTGLLEITLLDGVTATAKGSQGTMMLQVDDGGTIKTAYHIVTVK
jgi:hypothetical protein